MPAPAEIESLSFPDQDAWRAWLEVHHSTSPGVWLKLARPNVSPKTVTHPEALDICLRYGWIDGQSRSLDETHWLRKFIPRARRSIWSERNRARVMELTAEGLMAPAGLAEMERAKADGRWADAYAAQRDAVVPEDLALALAQSPPAAGFFAKLDSKNRYAILHRLHLAKQPATRARRLATFVGMLEREERLHAAPKSSL